MYILTVMCLPCGIGSSFTEKQKVLTDGNFVVMCVGSIHFGE